MNCWASCLGDCSDKGSREHLVSEGLFLKDVVRVQGFPWCKNEAKEIGISGLTSKILCTHHNNSLSPVDEAGAQAFKTLRELRRLANIREKLKPSPWTVVRYEIDGLPLERWLLKTMINLCCDREYPIGREASIPGRPAERLVRIAFGREKFKNRAGLYFLAKLGGKMHMTDVVGFAPLIKDGHHLEGGIFVFRGQEMLLFLEPDGPPPRLEGPMFNGGQLRDYQILFHIPRFNMKLGRYLSQVVTFRWP
jgi:hypothetical protein